VKKLKIGFIHPEILIVVFIIVAIGYALLLFSNIGNSCAEFTTNPNRCLPGLVCVHKNIVINGEKISDTGGSCQWPWSKLETSVTNTSTNSNKTANLSRDEDLRDWKTYRNEEFGFKFKYPSVYIVKEDSNQVTLSTTKDCHFTAYSDTDVSQIWLTFVPHTGSSYEDVWKSIYGFAFGAETGTDGLKTIDGKKAYFFYQGAEMEYGRTAYLVEVNENESVEINTYVPSYEIKCESELRNNSEVDQILSTFRFLSDPAEASGEGG